MLSFAVSHVVRAGGVSSTHTILEFCAGLGCFMALREVSATARKVSLKCEDLVARCSEGMLNA